MRINTINLQIVRNLGNYETLRIGAEWTPDGNQTLVEAMQQGMAELNETADVLLKAKAAPAAPAAPAETKKPAEEQFDHEFCKAWQLTPEIVAQLKNPTAPDGNPKMVVGVESKNLQKTCKRLEEGVELTKALEWIAPDEKAFAVLALAAKLNQR